MSKVATYLSRFSHTDRLSNGDTRLHSIDPRAKVATTLFCVVAVVSLGEHALISLLPFACYPVVLSLWGRVPFSHIASRLVLVSPFAVGIGILNPFLDHTPLLRIHGIGISSGWISFVSLLLKFLLTVSSALLLIAVTGFREVCAALQRLGVPRPFVIQLLFLHRYLLLIASEAGRTIRACELRTFQASGLSLRIYIRIIGTLLVRSFDRAQRIYDSMKCRGFDRTIHLSTPLKFTYVDGIFVVVWIAAFTFIRILAPGSEFFK